MTMIMTIIKQIPNENDYEHDNEHAIPVNKNGATWTSPGSKR